MKLWTGCVCSLSWSGCECAIGFADVALAELFDRKLTREKFWARPAGLNTDFYDLSNIRRGWSGRGESVMASNIIYSHRAEALTGEQIIQEALPAAGRAGDWTDTGLPASMESAVHSGWAAAEEIFRWQGTPRRLVLPKRAPQGIAGWVHGAG